MVLVACCPGGGAGARVHMAAVAVQVVYAGFQVLMKASLSSGLNKYIFLVYRNAIAALLVSPFAFFAEKNKRPQLTASKLLQFFGCALIGVSLNQTLFLLGTDLTTATFTSSIQNLIPVFTFVLACLLGLEKVHWLSRMGQAKVLGTTIAIGGAMVLTLCKGPVLGNFIGTLSSWELGAACLSANSLTWSIWIILQTPVLRTYGAQISATAFTFSFATLQLMILAVCLERDLSVWVNTLISNIPAIIYGGFVTSGVALTLHSWVAHRGGPVMTAAYQPLQTVMVALLACIFLGEILYLGRSGLCSLVFQAIMIDNSCLHWMNKRVGQVNCY